MSRPSYSAAAGLVLLVGAGCATLGSLGEAISAPRFSEATDRDSRIRLLLPSTSLPRGGAELTIWARVDNPNPVALTLTDLAGELFLEGTRAVDIDLPLGLPLRAEGDTLFPVRARLDFRNLESLSNVIARAVGGGDLDYRLDGSFSVEAAGLRTPRFGPTTLLEGRVPVLR